MASPVATLYAEELKATMRGRFAWLGAAAVLLAVGGLATVATQDTWLDGYGIIAYCLIPLGFIPLAIVAIAVFPVVLADTNYDKPAPPANNAPAIRALFARTGSSLALAPPGGQPPDRCCGTILNRDAWPFGTDERTRQDLLILLPVDATQAVSDLRIDVVGEGGLQATTDRDALSHAAEHLETRTYANDLGPPAALTRWRRTR